MMKDPFPLSSMSKTLEEVRAAVESNKEPDKRRRVLADMENQRTALMSALVEMGKQLEELGQVLDDPESIKDLEALSQTNERVDSMGSGFTHHCRQLLTGLISHQTDRASTEELHA